MFGMTVGSTRLSRELASLGVHRGAVLLVHCSLRSIGWVEGGAATLLDALLKVLGLEGTLLVPTQSASKSTTSGAYLDGVAGLSGPQLERYRAEVPGFDPATTPSEGMGALAEAVRTHPRAARSGHPTASFAAIGRRAVEATGYHPYSCLLGEQSPLGWMRLVGARVLLLGVGYDKCTAFHLGEHSSVATDRSYRFKIGDDWRDVHGARQYDDADFAELGADFEIRHKEEIVFGTVGAATCRLFPLTLAADFAARWLPATRREGADFAVGLLEDPAYED